MKKIFIITSISFPFGLIQAFSAQDLIVDFKGIADSLVVILFGVGLLVFFWGIARYILSAGDEAKAKEGKGIMIWGVVGLFIMASIWGIISWLQQDLLGNENPGTINIKPPGL